MSPTKKAAKKKAAVKKAAAKKTAPKKQAKKKGAKTNPPTRKASPAKTATKKTAGKATPKAKASPKPTKPLKPVNPVKPVKKAAASEKAAKPRAKKAGRATKKAARSGKPIPLSDTPHSKYGLKYECYSCETKFYLMGRDDLICPKCNADQNEKPMAEPKPAKAKTKSKAGVVRPMAPLLDDDDEQAANADSLDPHHTRKVQTPDEMFDNAEEASAREGLEEEAAPPAKDE